MEAWTADAMARSGSSTRARLSFFGALRDAKREERGDEDRHDRWEERRERDLVR